MIHSFENTGRLRLDHFRSPRGFFVHSSSLMKIGCVVVVVGVGVGVMRVIGVGVMGSVVVVGHFTVKTWIDKRQY